MIRIVRCLAALALALGAAGCSDVCPSGQAACGGSCRKLLEDPGHCGACGRACAPNAQCRTGECVEVCESGLTVCSGVCTDVGQDARNCGECGHGCATGEVCRGGACQTSCGPGEAICGAACAKLSSDRANCGRCGQACGNAQICAAGSCLDCDPGETGCGGDCVNLETSATHCGGCGQRCGPGLTCDSGTCVSCGALTSCGDACVDVSQDPNNCGHCAQRCRVSETCTAGGCVPCAGTVCANACVDMSQDPTNCGRCGRVCEGAAECVSSDCVVSCAAPREMCNGVCTSTQTDASNCGSCGHGCSGEEKCLGGACVTECLGGILCGTACVDPQTTKEHCGRCEVACASNQKCEAGHCKLDCAIGLTECGGACVDRQSSNAHCGACGNACLSNQTCIDGGCRSPFMIAITAPAPGTVLLAGFDAAVSAQNGTPVEVKWTLASLAPVTVTTSPFGARLDATALPSGAATLVAEAKDLAARTARAEVALVVDHDPPTVSLLSPLDGSFYPNTAAVPFSAQAADASGIAKVEFLVDGQVVGTATQAPFKIDVSALQLARGRREVKARATDAGGAAAESAAVAVYNGRLPGANIGTPCTNGWTSCSAWSPSEVGPYLAWLTEYDGGNGEGTLTLVAKTGGKPFTVEDRVSGRVAPVASTDGSRVFWLRDDLGSDGTLRGAAVAGTVVATPTTLLSHAEEYFAFPSGSHALAYRAVNNGNDLEAVAVNASNAQATVLGKVFLGATGASVSGQHVFNGAGDHVALRTEPLQTGLSHVVVFPASGGGAQDVGTNVRRFETWDATRVLMLSGYLAQTGVGLARLVGFDGSGERVLNAAVQDASFAASDRCATWRCRMELGRLLLLGDYDTGTGRGALRLWDGSVVDPVVVATQVRRTSVVNRDGTRWLARGNYRLAQGAGLMDLLLGGSGSAAPAVLDTLPCRTNTYATCAGGLIGGGDSDGWSFEFAPDGRTPYYFRGADPVAGGNTPTTVSLRVFADGASAPVVLGTDIPGNTTATRHPELYRFTPDGTRMFALSGFSTTSARGTLRTVKLSGGAAADISAAATMVRPSPGSEAVAYVGGTQAWLGPADATSAARILTASPYLFGEALGFGGAAPTAWFLHGVTPSFASWSGQIGIAALGSTGTPALWSAAGPHDFNGGAQTSAVASPDGTRLAFFGTWNSSSGVGRLDLGTAGQSPAQTLASQAIFSTRWEYELEPVAGGQAFLYATAPDQDNYWDIYRYLWSSGQSALISAQNQWWIELPGARVFYDEPDNSGLYRLRVADLRVLDPSRVADDEVRAVEDDQGRFYRFGAWVAYQVEAGVTARDGVYVWHAP